MSDEEISEGMEMWHNFFQKAVREMPKESLYNIISAVPTKAIEAFISSNRNQAKHGTPLPEFKEAASRVLADRLLVGDKNE